MADNWNEITVVARNAKGETSEVHSEFNASGSSAEAAAHEVMNASIKEYGTARVKEIDPAR